MQFQEKHIITFKSISKNRSAIYDKKNCDAPEMVISEAYYGIINFSWIFTPNFK
jgi:hypothetical protein